MNNKQSILKIDVQDLVQDLAFKPILLLNDHIQMTDRRILERNHSGATMRMPSGKKGSF